MRRTDLSGADCPIARTLDVVGDPWTLLVVREAAFGVTRFDEFQRRLEIPRNTLTARLDLLVDHGVLRRVAYQERPPRYDYHLTERGDDLRPVLALLLRWGQRWSGLADREPPPVVLVDADDGHELELELVDRVSGRALGEIDVARVVRLPGQPPRVDRATFTT